MKWNSGSAERTDPDRNLLRKNGAFVKKENIPEEDYRYPMIRMNGESS